MRIQRFSFCFSFLLLRSFYMLRETHKRQRWITNSIFIYLPCHNSNHSILLLRACRPHLVAISYSGMPIQYCNWRLIFHMYIWCSLKVQPRVVDKNIWLNQGMHLINTQWSITRNFVCRNAIFSKNEEQKNTKGRFWHPLVRELCVSSNMQIKWRYINTDGLCLYP